MLSKLKNSLTSLKFPHVPVPPPEPKPPAVVVSDIGPSGSGNKDPPPAPTVETAKPTALDRLEVPCCYFVKKPIERILIK